VGETISITVELANLEQWTVAAREFLGDALSKNT
jgi:hypothetical protein